MWIREYRDAKGMELDDFARAVNAYARRQVPPLVCTITDMLIHMLEVGAITHPRIANAIAGYCGATPEQRDMIVAEEHRGEWSGDKGAKRHEMSRMSQEIPGAKAVVKINRNGDVIAAYESVADAARREMHHEDLIRKRCQRKTEIEFTSYIPYTYRFQSEWMAMSREEQLADITRAGEIVGRLTHSNAG